MSIFSVVPSNQVKTRKGSFNDNIKVKHKQDGQDGLSWP